MVILGFSESESDIGNDMPSITSDILPVCIFLLKVNNRNTRTKC